jgi:hypothetical protein
MTVLGGAVPGGSNQPPVASLGYFGLDNYGALVEGSEGVSAVRLAAFMRQNYAQRPWGVVNDYISSALGMSIGLPVPPGTLIQLHDKEYAYVSLGFSIKGDRLPPVIFEKFVEERPWEATGIIAFDQWISNSDRHDENIGYHDKFGVAVFDHDLTLLMRSVEDPGGVLRKFEDAEVERHDLAPYMKTAGYFESWSNRISTVTTYEISRIVYNCRNADLITNSLAQDLVRFIEHRKSRVLDYIERTRDEYAKIAEWPFNLGEVNNES